MTDTPPLTDVVAEFFTRPGQPDLVPMYHRLLDEDPVHRAPNGTWIVSPHTLARTVVTSKQLMRAGQGGYGLAASDSAARKMWALAVVNVDEPDHTRLRSLASQAFSNRAVELLREKAEKIVAHRIAELAPRGAMNVTTDYSYPFTVEVICSMMGVPLEDGPDLVDWTRKLVFSIQPNATPEQYEQADEAARLSNEYFWRQAEERRAHPREDMITAFVQAEESGDRLSHDELAALALEMVSAGHETTANLIPNALYTLLRNPDQLELLRADPSLLPSAVEECLRYESSVPVGLPFTVAEDFSLGGRMLERGDKVVACLGAANRDPAVFDDPDRFDITRHPNRQLAFSGGMHFCLGNALARMETQSALGALLTLPGLRLADEPIRWRNDYVHTRSLEALHVEWSTA